MHPQYRHASTWIVAICVALVASISIAAQAAAPYAMPMKGVTRCVLNPIVITHGEAFNAYDAASQERLKSYLRERMAAAVAQAGLIASDEQWKRGSAYPTNTIVMNFELSIMASDSGATFGSLASMTVWRWLKTELSGDVPTLVCCYAGANHAFAQTDAFGDKMVGGVNKVLDEFVSTLPSWR